MADEDSELICLYYGADVTKDDADTLSDAIEDKFPECEVEVNFGGTANLLLYDFCRVRINEIMI